MITGMIGKETERYIKVFFRRVVSPFTHINRQRGLYFVCGGTLHQKLDSADAVEGLIRRSVTETENNGGSKSGQEMFQSLAGDIRCWSDNQACRYDHERSHPFQTICIISSDVP